jgi:signal transduction histidine kinase
LRNKRRDAASGAFSAFRVSEWSVRRKVVAVLAIPVVLAAVFGGLRVSSELQDASSYSTDQQRATALGPAVDFLTATENLVLPTLLADQVGDGATGARDQYATAAADFAKAAASADLTADQNADVRQMLAIGKTLEDGSGTGITADPPVALSELNRLATDLTNSTLNTAGTPDARTQALIQTLNGRLSLVKQQALIDSYQQDRTQLGLTWLAAEIGAEGTALDNLKGFFGGPRVAALTSANAQRLGNATNQNIDILRGTPRQFGVYDNLGQRLLDDISSTLSSNASASKSRALTDAGIILLALLASLLLALFVARALIVPLRKVRAGALEVAREKLPETVARIRSGREPEEIAPIPVHSHEELGQLARAVDDMHKQAVTLATGEAQLRSQVGAMFVTLSRRNTTLVNQQLALIESLEQDEEDPQRLEQLFSLDHLATRMRRTAESLVILGGTGGRAASFEELSVSDVIHAAVSEVQDYQRVRIDAAPDRLISGRVASDAVHLMAELIDNALSYSPPGSPVTIQAAEEDGKVEIEVIDSGLGMAGEALAQVNSQLKSGGEVTVDTARRMGLFVVSRLAEEHGLKVKLRRNTNGGGIIASVLLPASVLASDGPVEHISVLDAPQEIEEPVTPVLEEPEEEYDPYLERIEEAIAAVTGLPRRRPGQAVATAAPARAESVSMFDASSSPELPAAFEPTPLPSLEEPGVAPGTTEDEQVAAPAAEDDNQYLGEYRAQPEPALDEHGTPEDEESLAEVVTPDFGADRHEPVATSDPADEETEDEPDDVGQELGADGSDQAPDGATAEADHSEPDESRPRVASGQDGSSLAVEAPVAVVPDPSYDEPAPLVARGPVPAEVSTELPAGVPAAASAEEAPVRLQIRRPLSTASAASALEGDFVEGEAGPSHDSPIFGQLQSNWLSDGEESDERWSPNEVDRGWDAAERAETTGAETTTRTGLPVRRPGGRLLPGGVSQEPAKAVRDPEVIRNRLAAHAAGVSRGRAAAAAQPIPDDYAHEETGPA